MNTPTPDASAGSIEIGDKLLALFKALRDLALHGPCMSPMVRRAIDDKSARLVRELKSKGYGDEARIIHRAAVEGLTWDSARKRLGMTVATISAAPVRGERGS